jgi:hypothetical protein
MTSARDDEPGEGERTLSAGEIGAADGTAGAHGAGEVVIGEIPAADDPTTMLWTARCSEADHDLLGHFRTREEAETARVEHLASTHGGMTT